jgi:hypothetical protein
MASPLFRVQCVGGRLSYTVSCGGNAAEVSYWSAFRMSYFRFNCYLHKARPHNHPDLQRASQTSTSHCGVQFWTNRNPAQPLREFLYSGISYLMSPSTHYNETVKICQFPIKFGPVK